MADVLDNDAQRRLFLHDFDVNLVDADALLAVRAVRRVGGHQVLIAVLGKPVTREIQERCNDKYGSSDKCTKQNLYVTR